ncbi:MAG: hypothetical protein NTX64_11990 [Elusimicrobia bacterium]|nr:hypothetical protein [Elusimicrobiota bacterium]
MIEFISMNRLRLSALLLACASLAACADVQIGKGKQKVLLKDYAEGRVVDVALVDHQTGAKELLFISMPQKTLFLEGYIQGQITDYDDNPIEGVVVRAVAEGEAKAAEGGKAAFQTSSFDAGVTDTNGVYRIRFSLPVINRLVDVRGKFLYNPGFDQECSLLGQCYEPQVKESPFRIVFDEHDGTLVFAEGIRKVVVKAKKTGQPKQPLPEAKGQPKPGEGAPTKPAAEEDMFKGFGQMTP